MKKLWLLIFLLFSLLNTHGQNTSIALEKIDAAEMTGAFITALNSDNKGYLWVGTSNGLNRYDGYGFISFRSYKNDTTTLSHPSIKVIKQFSENELLVGTSKGLNAYSFKYNNFKRIKIDTTYNEFKKKNSIQSILQLKNGTILVGTQAGIMTYKPEQGRLTTLDSKKETLLDNCIIQSMCEDKHGTIWIGAKYFGDDGGIRFRVYKHFPKTNKTEELIISGYGSAGHVGISIDYKGTIWIGVDDGLVSINPYDQKQTFYKSPNNSLSNVSYFHSKDNLIYQGFWSFGVTVFDIDKKEFKLIKNEPDNPSTLISNKVWAVYKDDNNVVWFGTDVGLQKQSNKRPNLEIIQRQAGSSDNTFTSNQMLNAWVSRKLKDKIIVGIDGNGFSIYDKLTRKAENHPFGNRSENYSVEERFVAQYFEHTDGSIYIAGQYNFLKVDPTKTPAKIKHYFFQQQHHFTSIFQDRFDKNILWLGGLGQIVKFKIDTEESEFIVKPAGSSSIFFSGVSTIKGNIFTSQSSILKIKPDNTMQLISVADAGNITSIEIYDNDHVLLGTSFLGLIKYNLNTNTYEVIRNNRNNFFSEIRCIKKVTNSFWIGTNEGLYQYHPYSKEVLEFNLVDGLPSNIIQNIDFFEGFMYISTANGLVVFNPNSLISHFTIPRIDITSILGIGNDLEIISNLNDQEIEIPQSKNSFKINFTVLDFNIPEKNSYRYKLMPIQKEFKNNNHDRSVSFNELAVGEYAFQVIGSNSDNTWSEPAIIKIKIVPPFYQSKPFYYLLAFIFLSIAGGVIYGRYLRSKRTQAYLERTIDERTEEIRLKQEQLEKTNTELMDGITYAQKIQKAFLVGEKILQDALPQSFIYFKPKEKVSGDFFWIGKEDGYLIIAAGDCTGHGVPGAMLSVIGTTLLNKIVHEEKVLMPGSILSALNYLFYHQLNVGEKDVRDGMDISIITINLNESRAYFCGARNNGSIIKDNKLSELMAQRETIGENEHVEFNTIEIEYNTDATYYLYSDGYKDQFGGPQMKKLASKAFKETLIKTSKLMMNGQANYLGRFIKDWQGNNSQTDDRMIIGFKLR